jgi:Kef-type K+ transport system membrane component KefB
MHEPLLILLTLLGLLVAARAGGWASARLLQTSSAGELSAGIVLAAFLALIGDGWLEPAMSEVKPVLHLISDVGILFILLLAGVEMKPKEIAAHSAGSFVVAIGGVVVPMALGTALAWWYLPDSASKPALTFLIGVAMSITAVAATVKILDDFGVMHGRIGEIVISAAIFDDVIGLILLAVLTALIQTGHMPDLTSLFWLLAKVGVFFAVTGIAGVHVYPRLRQHLGAIDLAAVEFSILMLVTLAYCAFAELLGMHWILGAFMAGLYFEPWRVGAMAYNEIKLLLAGVTNGFLGPLFFVAIGLNVDLTAVTSAPLFLVLLIACAFFGKLVGAGGAALVMGGSLREATAIGIGMSARGEVELVVMSIAYEAGLFRNGTLGGQIFSSLILMAVATTILSPLLLRAVIRRAAPGG